MLPPTREHSFHFSTFAAEGLQLAPQKLLIWRPGGSFEPRRWQKRCLQGMLNYTINKTNKMLPKWVSKSEAQINMSLRFLRSPPQDGLQAVPRQALRPKRVLKWSPRGGYPRTFRASGDWISMFNYNLVIFFGDFPGYVLDIACNTIDYLGMFSEICVMMLWKLRDMFDDVFWQFVDIWMIVEYVFENLLLSRMGGKT